MKYLRLNLTKDVQGLYPESCKIPLREDLNKWRERETLLMGFKIQLF